MTHARVGAQVLLSMVVALATSTGAAADPLDHLKCYEVEDPSEAGATVELETLPLGIDSGCVIEAKARELCIPAGANVLAGASEADRGDDLSVERTCYEIDCPERALPSLEVSDRFGTRTVVVKRPRSVCLPASPPQHPR